MAIEMAERLVETGLNCRIVALKSPRFTERSKARFKAAILAQYFGEGAKPWSSGTKLPILRVQTLAPELFEHGEIVVAISPLTIEPVIAIGDHIRPCRWCHGLRVDRPEEMERVWAYPIPTAAITKSLAAYVSMLSGVDVAIVPNGIDRGNYFPEPDCPRDAIGLTYSSHQLKEPELAAKFVRRIKNELPGTPVISFGASRKLKDFKPDEYHRFPTIPEVRQLYSRSLIWICLSKSEGFGLPVLEAMACGAAIVTTDNNTAYRFVKRAIKTGDYGNSEDFDIDDRLVVDGLNGLMVSVGDIDGLVDMTRALFSDAENRSRLVKESASSVARYDWAISVSSMTEFLENVVAGKV